MKIVLMWHGKPKIDTNLRVNAIGFGAWVKAYNEASIDTTYPPPPMSLEQAKQCHFTVCSHLPRSLESASMLDIAHVDLADSLFREMDMPYSTWHFPKLPVLVWSVVFRLAWLWGYTSTSNVESFKVAKERARHCAERLVDLASTHDAVLFVGHGSLNWFIAQHLKNMGWSCAGSSPKPYWAYCVLEA